MKPRKVAQIPQADMFRLCLDQMLNQRHALYSMHAPEVECVAKGKTHRPHEFGVKIGIVSTSKESFVVGMKSLPGNLYDGHTLSASLAQVERLTGALPKEAYVDRGYKGHGVDDTAVYRRCQTRGHGSHQKEAQTAQRG